MKEGTWRERRLSRLNEHIQRLCGVYSRVARRFGVDRSYVSRIAKGERRSEEIETALITEFDAAEKLM